MPKKSSPLKANQNRIPPEKCVPLKTNQLLSCQKANQTHTCFGEVLSPEPRLQRVPVLAQHRPQLEAARKQALGLRQTQAVELRHQGVAQGPAWRGSCVAGWRVGPRGWRSSQFGVCVCVCVCVFFQGSFTLGVPFQPYRWVPLWSFWRVPFCLLVLGNARVSDRVSGYGLNAPFGNFLKGWFFSWSFQLIP